MSEYKIQIVSGEGSQGTVVDYTGKRTLRAIKTRLTKERDGNRWAKARVVLQDSHILHFLDFGSLYQHTGDGCIVTLDINEIEDYL